MDVHVNVPGEGVRGRARRALLQSLSVEFCQRDTRPGIRDVA
jgi:hypothetical protein